MTNSELHPFEKLTPELIMDAIEEQGYMCNGSVFALNSYENRVYQVGIEDQKQPLIAKFYRPQRWSEAQIQEEHDFCFELVEHEIPVVVPVRDGSGNSLFRHQEFLLALFPRKGGHAPELDHKNNLEIMGRTLARLHTIGEQRLFKQRPQLSLENFGVESIRFVSNEFIPFEHKTNYDVVTSKLVELIAPKLQNCHNIRVHGDLHIGNILMRDDIPNLVDFDDSRLAPAIQDIWMLLSGEEDEQKAQLVKVIQAYGEFRDFPFDELPMIESLRTLRMLHHCAWLARRWDDPAFAVAFPWFDQDSYWLQHINDLNNQLDVLQNAIL
ncbi:YihE protein, required for LPS synthesis [hydrothermal vent metagenome]|uniref:YihE protein, required for LPS synthesis n=1 Tax=hydrothermal vent metagenome TaxID=652676 RepID=A0A3B0V8Q7_9ZZZZ